MSSKLDGAMANFSLLEDMIADFKRKNAKLEAERDQLEAAKFKLCKDRLEFEAKVLEFEVIGGSCALDPKLESERNVLKVERAQLEADQIQLRIGQSQLKAAHSQLENAKYQLELAQSQLDGARDKLETARAHLEAAKAEVAIDGKRLEAARLSLEAAKVRFMAATKQMNAAKSIFESAKAMLDASASKNEGKVSDLENWISELVAEKSKLDSKIAQLEKEVEKCSINDATSSQIDDEVQRRLREEVKNLKIQLNRRNDEKKAMKDEIDKLKEALAEKPKILPAIRIYGQPKVFFDIADRGMSVGRIVMELDTYNFSHQFQLIDIFRALCTGEKGVDSKGVPIHFKGTPLVRRESNDYILGGGSDILGTNYLNEIERYYKERNPLPGERSWGAINERDLIVSNAPRPDGRCLFFIGNTRRPTELQQKYVKIGSVVSNQDFSNVMNFIATRSLSYSDWLRNKDSLVIADCGEL